MPNIKTFDTPGLGLQPSEIGVESRAAVGRRGGAFFNQAGQSLDTTGRRVGQSLREAGDVAVDYMDHQQINAGAEHGANLFAGLTDSWNQVAANADPHDPSVAKKWREEQLEPALAQFRQGFSTEKSEAWAEHFVDQTRMHMFAKTEADMSSLAGKAVESTIRTVANQFSNTAVKDPSAVPGMLDQVDHSIEGIIGANPNVKGPEAARVRLEVGEKVKEQIVKSGAFGAIQNAADPEAAAAKWAKDYPQYVNGAEELALARAAKVQQRSNIALEKQTQLYQRQLDKEGVDQARNKIWSDNVTVDPQTGQPTIKPEFFKQAVQLPVKFPNAPNATETAKTLLDWGERHQRPGKAATDPEIASDLDARMFAADNPTSTIQILRAEADGKLSHQDAQVRREFVKERDNAAFHDPSFKAAMDGAKQMIEGRTPGEKMLQAGKFAEFQQKFFAQYLPQQRAGTLPPNALNLSDPKSLISQTMEGYRSLIGQAVQGNGGVGAPPAVPAPKPAGPPPGFPADAQQANDGNWYVARNGKFYRVNKP